MKKEGHPVPEPMETPGVDALLSTVTRSGRAESWHRGRLVLVERSVGAGAADAGERVALEVGDGAAPVYARSAVKPFQALPFLELGLADALGCDDRELAVMSASHDGTERHREVVAGLLRKGGFGEDDLRCGPHAPFDPASRRALARVDGQTTRLMNNCSGKHAGFLLLGQHLGAAAADYLEPAGAAQTAVRGAVEAMCRPAGAGTEADAPTYEVGLDGCGAPTFSMPLVDLARGFARLANPAGLGAVREGACARLFHAIRRHPDLLAGERRFCTKLVRSVEGGVYPKNGAEGVYALGLPGGGGAPGLGLAIKITDGAERGYWPVVVEVLRALGVWDHVPEALAPFCPVPVRNTQGLVVGGVEATLPPAVREALAARAAEWRS